MMEANILGFLLKETPGVKSPLISLREVLSSVIIVFYQ